MYNNTEDMERLEAVVGSEVMKKICEEFGGCHLYIYTLKSYARKRGEKIINNNILATNNINELAKEYGVSARTIRNWAKRNSKQPDFST